MYLYTGNRGHNLKLVAIISNMQSATDCYSYTAGYCQLDNPEDCYARVCEHHFPGCLPMYRRQEDLWDHVPAKVIAAAFCELLTAKRLVSLRAKSPLGFIRFRFNEAGEIKSQKHLLKLAKVVEIVQAYCKELGFTLKAGGYSANIELRETPYTRKYLVIKGSGNDSFNGRCDVINTTADCPKTHKLCR